MGLVSGRMACFAHFMRRGDSFELLVARGNTVLSKFNLSLSFVAFRLGCGKQFLC